jgi:4-hydroxy-tetrahydrodipicolinate reductase
VKSCINEKSRTLRPEEGFMSHDIDRFELILVGCHGRMGQALNDAARRDATCTVIGGIDQHHQDLPVDAQRPVVVDFSSETGTNIAINLAHELQSPILVGTTGLSVNTMDALKALARSVPVAVVANTSLGIAVMQELIKVVGKMLGSVEPMSVDMIETHHLEKRDAPSGTSILLSNSITESQMELSIDDIDSVRTGEVVGTHEIRFTFGNERLTLSHEALDRSLFAEGAIQLARLVSQREPGLYAATDLLELR